MNDDPIPTRLQPLSEEWERALAVVAHPDDLEFGAAAAIARWTNQGKDIRYSLMTSGEAGIDTLEPAACGEIREQEQRLSAKVVGVDSVEFLGFPDGVIQYGLPLRRALTRAIRQHRPEVIITNNLRETWGPGQLNQADHIAAGRALLDAARDAANRWVFTDLIDEGLEPWKGVREMWAFGSPLSTHAVDVTETFATGLQSLHAHAAYLEALDESFDSNEILEAFARNAGARFGCRYAVAFEVFPLAPL